MTTLDLFRISTFAGAALFFAAGFLLARRRLQSQVQHEPQTLIQHDFPTHPQAQPHFPLEPTQDLDALRSAEEVWRNEKASLKLQRADLESRLLASQEELRVLAPELQKLRRQASAPKPAQEGQADELAALREERATLRKQLTSTRGKLDVAKGQLDASIQASRALEKQAAALQSELSLTQKRLTESQASHEDYIRLRTQRDENQFLKSELARIQAQLVDARAGGAMIPKATRNIKKPGDTTVDLGKLSLSEALDHAVQALLGDGVGSVVLADEVGFAVTHADEHGASLAAFSSLAVSAGDRAHSFAPVGRTKMISIVDEGGAQITVCPFDQGGARLSLVTLSRAPIAAAKITETVRQVTRLLERPRSAAQAV